MWSTRRAPLARDVGSIILRHWKGLRPHATLWNRAAPAAARHCALQVKEVGEGAELLAEGAIDAAAYGITDTIKGVAQVARYGAACAHGCHMR